MERTAASIVLIAIVPAIVLVGGVFTCSASAGQAAWRAWRPGKAMS